SSRTRGRSRGCRGRRAARWCCSCDRLAHGAGLAEDELGALEALAAAAEEEGALVALGGRESALVEDLGVHDAADYGDVVGVGQDAGGRLGHGLLPSLLVATPSPAVQAIRARGRAVPGGRPGAGE